MQPDREKEGKGGQKETPNAAARCEGIRHQRRIHRHKDRHTQTHTRTVTQHAYRQTDRQTGRHANIHTDTQTDSETNRQTSDGGDDLTEGNIEAKRTCGMR